MLLKILIFLVAAAIIAGGVYLFLKYRQLSREHRSTFTQMHELVQQWYQELSSHFYPADYNEGKVKELETGIEKFIKEKQLKLYDIKFDGKLRRSYLIACGVSKENADDNKLFVKYAKCPIDKVNAKVLWTTIRSAMHLMRNNHLKNGTTVDFVPIERQIKLLEVYKNKV